MSNILEWGEGLCGNGLCDRGGEGIHCQKTASGIDYHYVSVEKLEKVRFVPGNMRQDGERGFCVILTSCCLSS